jgi:hypothetical protein
MLQASLMWKQGKAREADAALAALAAGGGGHAVDALLMRAQLAAARGDSQQALAHLSVSARWPALLGCACPAAPAVLVCQDWLPRLRHAGKC